MRCILFVVGVLGVFSMNATADERFQWKGRVDGVDEILIRGRSVTVNHLEAKPIQRQDYRFSAALPSRDVEVELRSVEGRGRVRLMEQPSARNDYTAVVRIEDDKGGDADYAFELRWDDDDGWSSHRDDEDEDDWDDEDSVFRWEGRVDIGAEIEIHAQTHTVKDMGGRGTREFRADFLSSLPERDVPVSVYKIDGRGDVELVQAPDAANGYTAIVRIEDDKGGADNYEFELRWRSR